MPLWGANGKALCTAVGDQKDPQLVSDGAGGAIVVWADGRDGSGKDVYAQKIDVDGNIQWATNGTAICTLSDYSSLEPQICSDGNGGAIIAWSDNRTGSRDVYVQYVDSGGNPQLDANGQLICGATYNQLNVRVVCAGNGKAIIGWGDGRTGMDNDIYAYGVSYQGGGGIPGFALLYLVAVLLAIISINQRKRNS